MAAAAARSREITSSAMDDLREAARKGNKEALKKALAAGAEVNNQDVFGDTALHKAAKAGRLPCVKILLEAGANPNLQTAEYFYTPLHYASREGFPSIVKALIKAGADPNIKSKHGETAKDISFDDDTRAAFDGGDDD
eukprot:TRINITY_DN15187_c0_g1_i1.p1 TRINITY_DN15187_c0_g1~~TRINITY_DN15187_c0_g1_i1.p1  ORF type:complete len:149 (-),score=34.00 TRINITY_DN15187_c0_g1_i1:70-483(-)